MGKFYYILLAITILISGFTANSNTALAADNKQPSETSTNDLPNLLEKDFGEPIMEQTYFDENGNEVTERLFVKKNFSSNSRNGYGEGSFFKDKTYHFTATSLKMTYYVSADFVWGGSVVVKNVSSGKYFNSPLNGYASFSNESTTSGHIGTSGYASYSFNSADRKGIYAKHSVKITVTPSGDVT